MGKNTAYVPGAEFPFQYKYEHMAVTTDCVIFTYEDRKLKVLLVRRGAEPYMGKWAFPGGFLRMDETAEQGALRELHEETALKPSSIGQLGVFSDIDRDPRERVLTVAWYALVKPSEVMGGDDADEAAWFPVDDIPPLAFDHGEILRVALEQLRRDIHFQPVGFDLLDDEFTIPDLQRLYEAILGVEFDRRNFQRKILASGILEEAESLEQNSFLSDLRFCKTGSALNVCYDMSEPVPEGMPRKGRQGRPGNLFRLNRERYDQMKEDGGKLEF